MNCGPPDQLAPCFLDLNWGDSMGSIVSPAAADSATPAESLAVGELIGRLGSICNPGEIFPQSHYMGAPLNSPPKLHLSMMGHHHQQQQDCRGLPVSENPVNLAAFTTDPGFVERAARFSCFGGGGRNYGGVTGQFGLPETGKLSRISSCQSLKAKGSHKGSGEFGNAREESSASDPISASEGNARKRKAVPKGKGKDPAIPPPAKDSSKTAEGGDSNAKRSRSADNTKAENDEFDPTIEQNGGVSSSGDDEQKQGKEDNAKPLEPSKQDYIHVRARRGQATDSHSLAERVRREKISERMKLLQDLVPGCNKVNGKALMLDEIINYVQSLQRQVEFLSMKLATVNPRLDFDMENLLSKDIHQASENLSNLVYPLENSATAFSYAHQPQQCVVTNGIETQCTMNPLEHALHRTLSMQLPPIGGFGDANSQLGTFWEDDLQNVVQMGFGQSQEMAFSSQGFHDPLPDAHTKIEL